MKISIQKHLSIVPFWVSVIVSMIWLFFMYEGQYSRLFITADQAGYAAFKKQDYTQAANDFENLSYKGASLYRNASFKKAKSIYQNLSSKEDTYNLGNVFVMLGEYDNAIKSYERALRIDPNFKEAKENLRVAIARKILKEPENDGEQGVGLLGADEIVYDNKEGKGTDDTRSAQNDTTKGNPSWLDRLQTGPKDFLKNKFSYQYQMKEDQHVK